MEYIINPEETTLVKPICLTKCHKNCMKLIYYIIAPCPSFGPI